MRRKWQKTTTICLSGVLLGYFFVPGGDGHAFAASPAREAKVAILQLEDPVPADAQQVEQRYFTGGSYDGDCSYYQLLLYAERYAKASGADVLKVVARRSHSRTQPCDGIEVAFYRSDNPRRAEQSFQWDASRPLDWNDFRGVPRRAAGNRVVAETNCGIAIETSLTGMREQAKVYVFNTFDKQQSWVQEGFMRHDVLVHEQGHWDLCEVYTRRMQARFDAAYITGANLNREVARIYDAVSKEYVARQEQYEEETAHGTIDSEQARWTAMIAAELNASSLSKL